MKKIFMMMILIMGLVAVSYNAQADSLNIPDLLSKAPEVNQGYAYSVLDSQFKPTLTADVYKVGNLALQLGITTSDDKININEFTEVIGEVSYTLLKASDIEAIKSIPVVNLIKIEPFLAAGWDRIDYEESGKGNNEYDALVGINFVSYKF